MYALGSRATRRPGTGAHTSGDSNCGCQPGTRPACRWRGVTFTGNGGCVSNPMAKLLKNACWAAVTASNAPCPARSSSLRTSTMASNA